MPASEGFSVGLEGDHVFLVPPGDDERSNSTNNRRTEFPIVADPTGFDLNQAYLRYRDDSLTVTMGRQRILHGGQRIVGGVAWRQNEQTFDALRVQSSHDKASIDYSYVVNVNRIFGPDDGAASFRTPAATLHKFQGWTDKFLATPPAGVKDFHLKAATKVDPAALGIALHDFKAAEGGADYGREVDISVSCPLGAKLGQLFKFARYSAREHATNTTKGWFVVTYTL